jgi:DNA ligase-1
MSAITKPMLSGKVVVDKLRFPLAGTAKIDGIRAIMIDGKLVSRSFKPIKNDHIRTTLERILPEGADGEVLSGNTFQACSSAVMRQSGEPDFYYYMFDYVKDGENINRGYMDRIADMEAWYNEQDEETQDIVRIMVPNRINNQEELDEFEELCLDQGLEGVMVRSLNGPYKCGRSSTNEGHLLKLKRFLDSEAVVISCEELMHNDNVATKDAFGRTERSSHKENKRASGTLGYLVVEDINTGLRFSVGTGFTAAMRADFWDRQDELIGKLIKYKYFPIGVKDLPRHPVFEGFRDPDDM